MAICRDMEGCSSVEKEEGVVDALHTMHVGVVALWWECGMRVESVQVCVDEDLGCWRGGVMPHGTSVEERERGCEGRVTPVHGVQRCVA